MAYEQKPNSGTFWHQVDKRSDKAPDFTGSIHFDRDYLRDLVDNAENQLVEVKFSGWRNKITTKNGDRNVLNVSVDTFKPTQRAATTDAKDPWDE